MFDDHGSNARDDASPSDRTCYVFPVSWSGVPTSNPTNALITTSVEFLLNGEAVDGGVSTPTGTKLRARELCELKADTGPGTTNPISVYEPVVSNTQKTGFFSARPNDRIFLVVTCLLYTSPSPRD